MDLDTTHAVTWARETLPATRRVPTTRGQHWLYLGTMPSANAVRPGADIKSRMAYARWLGCGTATMTALPSPSAPWRDEKKPPRPARGWLLLPPHPPGTRPPGHRGTRTPAGTHTGGAAVSSPAVLLAANLDAVTAAPKGA